DIVGVFVGMDDFGLDHQVNIVSTDVGADPAFNSGTSHFLAPEDYTTIYNLAPLYQSGLDGTGQKIVIVGQSSVLLSDLRAFRTRYNLAQNDPTFFAYSGVDPGLNGAQLEGNLDLEWVAALAPKAQVT